MELNERKPQKEHEPLSVGELNELLQEWIVDAPPQRLRQTQFPPRRKFAPRVVLPAALVAAAAILIAIVETRPHPSQPAAVREASEFTPIPYTLPLADGEGERVVRMDISIAALWAAGLRVPAIDPGSAVTADVILGDDGRARGVRIVKAIPGE